MVCGSHPSRVECCAIVAQPGQAFFYSHSVDPKKNALASGWGEPGRGRAGDGESRGPGEPGTGESRGPGRAGDRGRGGVE